MRKLLPGMVLVSALASPAIASAQTRVQNSGFRHRVVVDDTLLRKGRMEIDLQSAGAWSKDSAKDKSGSGTTVSTTSFYANPAAAFGYMILDALQVKIAAGYLAISTKAADVKVQNLGAFRGDVEAIYHIKLRLGTALYVGVGGGYFTGSTDRPGPDATSTVSDPTSGFAGLGDLGLLLQPGPSVVVRGGVRLDALSGTETSPNDAYPDLSTTNLKLMGHFAIGFRF